MIIDAGLIENGVTPEVLAKLINRHAATVGRYAKLDAYYRGEHAILNRQRKSEGTANNRIVLNHAKYITDITTSYLIGNAVTYAPSEGYDIEPLKDNYLVQDIASLDYKIAKNVSIHGRAYELIYADDNSDPHSALLPPQNAFVVYGSDCEHKPILGVYYYRKYDIDGNVTGTECRVYDVKTAYTYGRDGDSFDNMELTETTPHYFSGVPLIEYTNNDERQGDFEQLIPAIDAYNTLMSDRVNDKEQFVDAFLFLRNVEIDSDQARKLKAEKILMGYEDSSAEYLSKVMTEADIKVLRDDLKGDIHRFSAVPDLSDESFGNNLSGVAIKYKLLGFEQRVLDKEQRIANGLKRRAELYINFLNVKGAMTLVPIHRIDVKFKRNLPANELEISQMVTNLEKLVSSETLLAQIPFVTDAEEEAENAKKEAAEKSEAFAAAAANGDRRRYNVSGDEE